MAARFLDLVPDALPDVADDRAVGLVPNPRG
jgi:hypothetical protein